MIRKIVLFVILLIALLFGTYYFQYIKQNKYLSQFDCELINQRKCIYFIALDCMPIPDKSVCDGVGNHWSPNY